jgi:coproporphyrinogen III oxidase-like Fe-S oxidoreductase
MAVWQSDLEKAVGTGVESIMCHALEVHPTKLARQLKKGEVPPIGNGRVEIDMYLKAREVLKKAGYVQWSLTHWMLPGTQFKYEREVRANRYDYFGLGLGSLSRIEGFVSRNISRLGHYIDAALRPELPIAGTVKLSSDDTVRSYVLRRIFGAMSIEKQDFFSMFGEMPEKVFPETIQSLQQKGLIEISNTELTLTDLGIIWAGKVCEAFCSDDFLHQHDESGWIQKHSIQND